MSVKENAAIAEFLTRVRPLTDAPCFSTGHSDKHNGGRSVIFFSAGGVKYVYKPRPSALDEAVYSFFDALDEMGAPLLPRFIRPVPGIDPACTVVHYVQEKEADSVRQVREFFQRWGTLLAFIELFCATDLHMENVIACGDSPVVIDLETMLSGMLPARGHYDGGLYDSLMFCHVLPHWVTQENENIDLGALTADGPNRLRFGGIPCEGYQYSDEILRGFADAYRFILAHRTEISSLLELFNDCQFRKLLRPTDVYSRLVARIAQSDSEDERLQQAKRLRRVYMNDADPVWAEKMNRVCQSEIDAVLCGDIPYFYSLGSECCLRDRNGVVCDEYFALSPVDHAKRRLQMMDEQDLHDQQRIIEQSLQTTDHSIVTVPLMGPDQVYNLLEEHAINGNASGWIGLDADNRGRSCFQSIGFDLYGGLLGILCFYAALYDANRDEHVRITIEKRYQPYRSMYLVGAPFKARPDTINLTHGLGGHILALTYLSQCLQDECYMRDAVQLFRRADFSSNFDFSQSDVYGGVSGLLIVLPRLMGQGIDRELKQIAALLADGIRSTEPELTGFGHGAAGIASALSCAQTVLGDHSYEVDILRMLQNENMHYSEEKLNWPDLRDPDRIGFMHGLCAGAPGIGIARKLMLSQNIGSDIREICMKDIERVKSYYSEARTLRRDSLCCGNAARIIGELAVCETVEKSTLNASPVLVHMLNTNDFPAGLLQGWAGVGYALVRSSPKSGHDLFL